MDLATKIGLVKVENHQIKFPVLIIEFKHGTKIAYQTDLTDRSMTGCQVV